MDKPKKFIRREFTETYDQLGVLVVGQWIVPVKYLDQWALIATPIVAILVGIGHFVFGWGPWMFLIPLGLPALVLIHLFLEFVDVVIRAISRGFRSGIQTARREVLSGEAE